MNRIVKEHYPASKLPDDLREGLAPGSQVTVTIVEEQAQRPRRRCRWTNFSLCAVRPSVQAPKSTRSFADKETSGMTDVAASPRSIWI